MPRFAFRKKFAAAHAYFGIERRDETGDGGASSSDIQMSLCCAVHRVPSSEMAAKKEVKMLMFNNAGDQNKYLKPENLQSNIEDENGVTTRKSREERKRAKGAKPMRLKGLCSFVRTCLL